VKNAISSKTAYATVRSLSASAYWSQEGWRKNSDGNWVYVLSNGQVARKDYSDSWQRLPDRTGTHWFYLNSDGVPYTNTWITDNNDDTYYMNNMGHITYTRGWRRNDNGDWVFIHSDGKVAKKHYTDSWDRLPDSTGWHWFYLNSHGVPYMNTWITDNNDDTYYMDNMGHITYTRGWRRNDNGDWVFIHSDGKVAKKHYTDSWDRLPDSTGSHWFYLNSHGVPYMNTWITDNNDDTYYMDNMGHITYKSGWRRNDNGDWVFIHSDGKVAKKHYSDSWQLLPDSTGWHWFYVNSHGVPYTNTWITDDEERSYYLDSMGHIA
jgi:glucan-binding YG repeat protein